MKKREKALLRILDGLTNEINFWEHYVDIEKPTKDGIREGLIKAYRIVDAELVLIYEGKAE